jgi:hypothetical protein
MRGGSGDRVVYPPLRGATMPSEPGREQFVDDVQQLLAQEGAQRHLSIRSDCARLGDDPSRV